MAGSRTDEAVGAKATRTRAKAKAPAAHAEQRSGPQGEGTSGPEQVSNGEAAPPTLNQIRYPCLMNMDYHAAREGWLDQIHRWLMFAVIVAGASALLDLWPYTKIVGPLVAALAGALDLTFDLSNRARNHAMFRRRYADVLAEATREPDKLAALQCRIDEIAGEEEPVFSAQLALSDMKAQDQTYGRIVYPCRPGFLYRRFANVFRFPGHTFTGE